MSTPHNEAKINDIAKNVLMPGDPLRAKFVADNFLENVKLVNTVRNMFAFTGEYKGKKITIMASGMGMPSMGIYSYELFNIYNVENIIRVGSAGAYTNELELFDVVLAKSVWTESTFAKTQNGSIEDTIYPNIDLNNQIIKAAKKLELPIHLEKVHSTDVFYTEDNMLRYKEISEVQKCACVEMESFALLHNAKVLGKKAACLLTISDSYVSGKETSANDREKAFMNMIKIALETFC